MCWWSTKRWGCKRSVQVSVFRKEHRKPKRAQPATQGFWFQVSGFGFQVSGFRCQGSGFRGQVSGFRVQLHSREHSKLFADLRRIPAWPEGHLTPDTHTTSLCLCGKPAEHPSHSAKSAKSAKSADNKTAQQSLRASVGKKPISHTPHATKRLPRLRPARRGLRRGTAGGQPSPCGAL
jgi:hypothetical protein